jgi:hypothetical protein
MLLDAQQREYAYCVQIETRTGESAVISPALLTQKQVKHFVQFEFKRLSQEAGIRGSRIHVEQVAAVDCKGAADYNKVISDVAARLRSGVKKVA